MSYDIILHYITLYDMLLYYIIRIILGAGRAGVAAPEAAVREDSGSNHLSNATCLTQVSFKSGQ